MATKIICDFCKVKEADMKFKINKKFLSVNSFDMYTWSGYQNYDICNDCFEKILNAVKDK